LVVKLASIFAAVLVPCKLLAGAGFLYSMLPLLKADLHELKRDAVKIICTFVLVLMFINNGTFGRAVGIGNYAFIQGINKAIDEQLELIANVSTILSDIGADEQTVEAIETQLQKCLALPRENNDGTPNPEFTACDLEVRNQISTAQFKNPNLQAKMTDALTKGDLISVGKATVDAAWGFLGWVGKGLSNAAMMLPKLLFDGWNLAIGIAVKVAFALSLAIMPVPLALSLLYPAPLQAWFAGLWALGIFQWSLTILTGAFAIISSKLGGSAPLFLVELLAAFAAPALAAGLAASGAYGVYKLAEQGSQAAISAATKAVAAV
jgi:hypothetical protein